MARSSSSRNHTAGTRWDRVVPASILLTALLASAILLASPDDGAGRAVGRSVAAPATTTSTSTTVAASPGEETTQVSAPAGDVATDPAADEVDDDLFPEVPDADPQDPGPWFPPPLGPSDFAPNPVVLDLVAEVDPELGEGGDAAVGGSYAADAGCSVQCIRRATATLGGTDVEIRVRTNTPARIWVVLDSPAVKDSTGLTTDWTTSFDGLQPDTTYNVTLAAQDEYGHTAYRYAQLRTLARNVRITFTSIDVIDDADKYAVNKGEIEFFFSVDGAWQPDAHVGTQKIKSGTSIRLGDAGKAVVVDDAPQVIELRVQGIEHDSHATEVCTNGTPPFDDWDGGDAGPCLDTATARAAIDLDDLQVDDPALPSWNDGYFRLVTEDHYLKFAVNGTIDVTYG